MERWKKRKKECETKRHWTLLVGAGWNGLSHLLCRHEPRGELVDRRRDALLAIVVEATLSPERHENAIFAIMFLSSPEKSRTCLTSKRKSVSQARTIIIHARRATIEEAQPQTRVLLASEGLCFMLHFLFPPLCVALHVAKRGLDTVLCSCML